MRRKGCSGQPCHLYRQRRLHKLFFQLRSTAYTIYLHCLPQHGDQLLCHFSRPKSLSGGLVSREPSGLRARLLSCLAPRSCPRSLISQMRHPSTSFASCHPKLPSQPGVNTGIHLSLPPTHTQNPRGRRLCQGPKPSVRRSKTINQHGSGVYLLFCFLIAHVFTGKLRPVIPCRACFFHSVRMCVLEITRGCFRLCDLRDPG